MNEFLAYISESVRSSEFLMCQLILDYAKAFYQDPKNQAAYQEWLKSRAKDL